MLSKLFSFLFKRPTTPIENEKNNDRPTPAIVIKPRLEEPVEPSNDIVVDTSKDDDLIVREPLIPIDSLSLEDLQHTLIQLKYGYHGPVDKRLNLIGVRNTENKDANTFNDRLYVLFYIDAKPVFFSCPMTTDPGLHYRHNLVSTNGTAIVVPGVYRDVWRSGKHKGQYAALVQNKPISVYRDADRNGTIDIDSATIIATGFFGINLHRASATGTSIYVDKWSAGCQVIPNINDFQRIMGIVETYFPGDSFDYILLTQDQLLRAP